MGATGSPSTARMLARGLGRRCPRCGQGRLFTRWVRMVERCPRCRYRFEREEGFFLGAFVVNFGVTEGLLLVVALVPFIALRAAGRAPDTATFVAVALAVAVVAPAAFYPFSRTLWAAIDLAMHRPPEDAAG